MKAVNTKIISIKYLSEKSKIDYFRIRNNFTLNYTSKMNLQERTLLANTIVSELESIMNYLEFELSMTPKKKK